MWMEFRNVAKSFGLTIFNKKLRIDLFFPNGITTLHVLDVFLKYSSLSPERPKGPQDEWDILSGLRIGIFGPPKCIQMDERG